MFNTQCIVKCILPTSTNENGGSLFISPDHSPGFRRSSLGFTLVELMFVVSLMAILAAISFPYYKSFIERTEGNKVEQDMQTLEREINSFFMEKGRYPDSLEEVGLDTLADPWGNPYQYLNVEEIDKKGKDKSKIRKDHSLHPVNTDFDLYSMGPDGKTKAPFTAKHSRDDYVRANNGAFFGYVSEY